MDDYSSLTLLIAHKKIIVFENIISKYFEITKIIKLKYTTSNYFFVTFAKRNNYNINISEYIDNTNYITSFYNNNIFCNHVKIYTSPL